MVNCVEAFGKWLRLDIKNRMAQMGWR